jgi:hypothetical protein
MIHLIRAVDDAGIGGGAFRTAHRTDGRPRPGIPNCVDRGASSTPRSGASVVACPRSLKPNCRGEF